MTARPKKTTAPPPPTPQAVARRLGNLRGVRHENLAVYADARLGKVKPTDAAKLAFVLGHIRESLVAEACEQRLVALERRAEAEACR